MPDTPTLLLPYPAATDPADVPTDLRELAERLELVMPGKGRALKITGAPIALTGTHVDLPACTHTLALSVPALVAMIAVFDFNIPAGGFAIGIPTIDGAEQPAVAAVTPTGAFRGQAPQIALHAAAPGSHTWSLRAWGGGGAQALENTQLLLLLFNGGTIV